MLIDLSQVPWHAMSDLSTAEDVQHTFEILLCNMWDMHAPLKRKQRRCKSVPWMMSEVLAQLRDRKKLYQHFVHNFSDSNWMRFKQARNYGTKLIRMAKRFYLLRTATDSRNCWKTNLNCTGLGRKRHVQLLWPCSSPTISKITADTVNNFFLSTIDKIASTFTPLCCSDATLPSEVLNDNTRTTACFSL